jgi:SagB-type dehydrogenase family enzyme
MKKILLILSLLFSCGILSAQEIHLPDPQRTGGLPLMEALNKRQSTREYSDKLIDAQNLSNLLWAAWGYNRGTDKRTAPSSQNFQEIDIYLIQADGFYLYNAKNQSLIKLGNEDLRHSAGMQDFVYTAPLNLIYVADLDKTKTTDFNAEPTASYANTGFIAQNVYLYCASAGLGSVVRGSYSKDLKDKLHLREHQRIILTQTVGWPK